MKIEVVTKDGDSTKQRGDLLEDLASKLLEAQNFEVEKEIRNTGMELDLLCKHKANVSKKIYVECKAYKETNKIQADVIKNIVGIKSIENYTEVWLIATSELGKDAKGLKEKIESGGQSKDYTFYTPERLIEALKNSKTICEPEVAKSKVLDKVKSNNKIGNKVLLITEYGYFYLFEHLEGGVANDVYVTYANNGEIVDEKELLENLKNTDSSYREFDFNVNLPLIDTHSHNIVQVVKSDDLKLNNAYLTKINDTGIKLTHPNKNELTLKDIFVFQDLQDIEDNKKSRISSSNLLDVDKYQKCIIFGEEVSGKTALICTLQKELNGKGSIPVFVDAQNIRTSDHKKFKSLLVRNFKKQYCDSQEKSFISLIDENSEKIIIMIDNFEALAVKKSEYKSLFLEMLNTNFKNIYIFSDDSAEMEIMTKDALKSKLQNFGFYKIKEYGHKLRDEIIEKWLTVGMEEVTPDNHLLERKDEVFRILETMIGNKFIPTYPLYIVTLLQQIESGAGGNLGGSAYAEFYNYLIIQALNTTRIKADELDFYHAYLSYLAYHYFVHDRKELEKSEIEKLHEQYSAEYHKESFSVVYKNLIDAKLIKENNNYYKFGHNYIYYFYVAKYLSDNMDRRGKGDEVKEKIGQIIKKLHRPEFANIIIFLIHHSKTQAENIIDKIMDEAKVIFIETSPATLSKSEISMINELVNEEIQLVIEDKNPHDHRRQTLELKDEIDDIACNEKEDASVPQYDEDIGELDMFGKVNLSMKLMEILGQIAKNYYGSLNKNDKSDLLNEVCNLGLRNLSLFIQRFTEYKDLLEKEIQEKIDKKKVKSASEIERISRKIIFNFTELICIHFIKKVSSSIVSKNLFDDIERLQADSEAMKLVSIATKLDFPGGLNKDKIISLNAELAKANNLIPKELLRFLVIEHLYKFDVEYKKRQEVCKKLNIGIAAQKNILSKKSSI